MPQNFLDSLIGARSAAAAASAPARDDRGGSDGAWTRARAWRDDARYGAALAELSRLADANPGDPETWLERARLLDRWERHREAAAAASQAVRLGISATAALADAASILVRAGDAAGALALLEATRLRSGIDPALASAWAAALHASNRGAEAIDAYATALALPGAGASLWRAKAECHTRIAQHAAARDCLQHALALDPDDDVAWEHLGALEAIEGRYDEAFRAFERAEAIVGDDARGDATANHAIALFRSGRWTECRAMLLASLPSRPSLNGHMQLGPTLLAHGEFDEGWKQYEFRWLVGQFAVERPVGERPHWNGQDLRGRTILVLAEQGIGDLVQFSRYLPMLQARGARVVMHEPAGLERFAAHLPGVDVLLKAGERAAEHDYFAFLLSLPRAFGTRIDTIPPCAAWLRPDAERSATWQARLGPRARPRIGLVWAGRPAHARDLQRSIPLDRLAPLLGVPGASFVGLQKGPAVVQAETVPESVDWINVGPELDDLDDAMAVIAELDLLVTVDTGLAHLAGAMGRPVWTLVANPPDFRWLVDGEDTPWYPTMRIVRQRVPGDWSEPVRRAAADLRRWIDAADAAQRASVSAPAPASPARTVRTPPVERRTPGLARAGAMRAGFLQYDPDEPLVGVALEHYGEWLQPHLDVALALAGRGGTVLELRAGIGSHAVALGRALGPGGHLIAEEPRAVARRMLATNLRANGVAGATLLARAIVDPGQAAQRAGADTIDDLGLGRLEGLKLDAGAGAAVLDGATDTLWRCRPWVVATFEGDDALAAAGARLREHGYRLWRLRTPMMSASNFQHRDDDRFAGRAVASLIGLPEERDARLAIPGCIAWD